MTRFALFYLIFSAVIAVAADKEHATIVTETPLYSSPGANSQQVISLERGRDMIILERTKIANQDWIKVVATIAQGEAAREVTGWASGRNVVSVSTPNGDQITYGEAVDSENQAEQRGGRKGAAQDAMRLYHRTYDLFPNSPLAGEALWRAADIRWQLDRSDIMIKPGVLDMTVEARPKMDEQLLRQVIQKFPQTRWSDLAAYDLLDNQLCGGWKGLSECPEKESALYLQYAQQHPRSPKAAEALYNAAWRQAALADIYSINNDKAKSDEARRKASDLAQQILNQFTDVGWKTRAINLTYKMQHNLHVYGNAE